MVESKNQTHNEEKSAEDSDDTLVEMPLNCAPLSHQVAGHFYGQGRTKLGLLQTNDGIILKPVQSPPHGEREHDFYKRLFQRKDHELSGDEVELRKLLPTYRGFVLHNESKCVLRVQSCSSFSYTYHFIYSCVTKFKRIILFILELRKNSSSSSSS